MKVLNILGPEVTTGLFLGLALLIGATMSGSAPEHVHINRDAVADARAGR